AQQIRRGYELDRNDPNACFNAGRLAASEGDWVTAEQRFRRCLEITNAFQDEISQLLIRDLQRPDVALRLVNDDVHGIMNFLAISQRYSPPAEVIASAKAREKELVLQQAPRDGADRDVLLLAARYAADGQDYGRAVALFRRALS